MPRALHKLTARACDTIKAHGRHGDGGGLYLVVDANGKRWAFLYRWRGRRVEMGLGGFPIVSLAKARDKAREARKALAEGSNPRDKRRATAAIPTFAEAAEAYIAKMAPRYKSAKHLYQWQQTMGESYCAGIRGKLVSGITTEDVLSVLTPIWQAKPETAARVRGR